jgi:hypothetical protein
MSKQLLRSIGHAALGGAAAALAMIPAGAPLTIKTVIYPALASALTSVISLFAQSPNR